MRATLATLFITTTVFLQSIQMTSQSDVGAGSPIGGLSGLSGGAGSSRLFFESKAHSFPAARRAPKELTSLSSGGASGPLGYHQPAMPRVISLSQVRPPRSPEGGPYKAAQQKLQVEAHEKVKPEDCQGSKLENDSLAAEWEVQYMAEEKAKNKAAGKEAQKMAEEKANAELCPSTSRVKCFPTMRSLRHSAPTQKRHGSKTRPQKSSTKNKRSMFSHSSSSRVEAVNN